MNLDFYVFSLLLSFQLLRLCLQAHDKAIKKEFLFACIQFTALSEPLPSHAYSTRVQMSYNISFSICTAVCFVQTTTAP